MKWKSEDEGQSVCSVEGDGKGPTIDLRSQTQPLGTEFTEGETEKEGIERRDGLTVV